MLAVQSHSSAAACSPWGKDDISKNLWGLSGRAENHVLRRPELKRKLILWTSFDTDGPVSHSKLGSHHVTPFWEVSHWTCQSPELTSPLNLVVVDVSDTQVGHPFSYPMPCAGSVDTYHMQPSSVDTGPQTTVVAAGPKVSLPCLMMSPSAPLIIIPSPLVASTAWFLNST